MHEPSPRNSRLAIAGSLVAVMLVGAGGFMLGRETAPYPVAATVRPEPALPAKPQVQQEPTPRTLNRRDFLALAGMAADTAASGGPAPALLAQAPGQRFELYLPFGCDGSAAEGSQAPLRWRYDADERALRVHVAPTNWAAADWWQSPPGGIEALEGFWIARPWSSRETCVTGDRSAVPSGTEPITLPGQTLGIAEVVTKDTPRQLQRAGKPYESVVRVAPEAARFGSGLRVRVRGRIASFPGEGAVRCTQPGGSEQRPVCLMAVSFEEVAVDNPATGEAVAIWSPTTGNAASAEF